MIARRHAQPTSLTVVQIVCIIGGLIASAGCHGGGSKAPTPTPMAAPAVKAFVTHHPGGLLARPTTRAIPAMAASDAPAVHATWTALVRVPASKALVPLTSTARLIAVPTSTQPIATTGRLLANARIANSKDVDPFLADLAAGRFGPTAEIATQRAALPPDVTAVFALAERDGPRRLEVAVYRPADTSAERSIQFGLFLGDAAHRERVLLDPVPLTDGATKVALIVPSQFGAENQSRAALAVIELVANDNSKEHADALAACVKELAAPAATTTQPVIPMPADASGLAAAMQTLSSQPRAARSALVFLAGQTGATLCGDVALVADDWVLASLAKRVSEKAAAAPIGAAKLGWLLDSACFEELSALQSAEKMPPELSAALTAYAGEAGRHAASLDEVARGLSNRDQLEARLLAENLVYLEDASPAARVRAYDWLRTRNRAPAGYDPLGPNKQRRAALEKAATPAAPAIEAKSSEGGAR